MGPLAKGVAEIRVSEGGGAYLAFFVVIVDSGILVFHGFKKKSQKTPQTEIETGRARLTAFMKGMDL